MGTKKKKERVLEEGEEYIEEPFAASVKHWEELKKEKLNNDLSNLNGI